jgi:hypothetical protein
MVGLFILYAFYAGLLAFPIGNKVLRGKTLKNLQDFVKVGITMEEIQSIFTTSFSSYVWAIADSLSSGTSFQRGRAQSIHHAYCLKYGLITSKTVRWDTAALETKLSFLSLGLLAMLKLTSKKKEGKRRKQMQVANLQIEGDQEFIVKAAITEI